MTENPEPLRQRIGLGEDSRLELKAVVFTGRKVKGPSRDQIADELAAFANSSGGTFVFGVDDKSRRVAGIANELLDVVQDLVVETCKPAAVRRARAAASSLPSPPRRWPPRPSRPAARRPSRSAP
ncbi:MAG: ATP-binding protein [Planctomycetota bacterium]